MAITVIGRKSCIRRRYAAASVNSEGEVVRGGSVDTSFIAEVQPARPGKEVETIPTGERRFERLYLYTEGFVDLRPTDQHSKLPADEVVIDSIVYRVQKVDSWPDGTSLIPHTKAWITRRRETE